MHALGPNLVPPRLRVQRRWRRDADPVGRHPPSVVAWQAHV
jgi:hypothetical protein